MTTTNDPNVIYCLKCRTKTETTEETLEQVTLNNGTRPSPRRAYIATDAPSGRNNTGRRDSPPLRRPAIRMGAQRKPATAGTRHNRWDPGDMEQLQDERELKERTSPSFRGANAVIATGGITKLPTKLLGENIHHSGLAQDGQHPSSFKHHLPGQLRVDTLISKIKDRIRVITIEEQVPVSIGLPYPPSSPVPAGIPVEGQGKCPSMREGRDIEPERTGKSPGAQYRVGISTAQSPGSKSSFRETYWRRSKAAAKPSISRRRSAMK